MLFVKTLRNQYVSYPEYNVGNNNQITIEFEFRFPANFPQHFIPQLTTATLYDSQYVNLQLIPSNAGAIDLSPSGLNVNKQGETFYHLFFQSNFIAVNPGKPDKDVLEDLLKKCETIYTISGGADGKKVYTLFDSAGISEDKKELFIFKQIELKK